ncbi:hypothetical protein [Janthinobacterium fluminis]|uniref:Meckel syndrome type 1 protein n=1 Tax=Janthinobacterium fluminis TaxID=2987524 RepID=A0ABT5JUY3_9BURK|nr:hypothetical protein [Janthinobacterium fluminis]MDC8755995.1 hypothetical protein [Janthinobacterium fluminis]
MQATKPPELLGKSTPEPADHSRILASLEHGAPVPQRPRPRLGRGGVAALALLLLIGAGWLGYRHASAPPPDGVEARRAAPPREQPQPVAALRDMPAPAAIVNDATAAPPAQRPAAAPDKAGTAPASQAPAAPRAPARPRVAAAGTSAPPKKAPASAAVPPDSDVALLTALVAHVNKQDAGGAAGTNRDVVLRGAHDTTDSLLQRCKQLGVIEGMLCRSRICAGRWDNDPACK